VNVYDITAAGLSVEPVDLTTTNPHVEIEHHLQDDSGTITSYYVTLTPADARRFAKRIQRAAKVATAAAR